MSTVAEVVVAGLAAHHLDRVFCVPGESCLALLDALYDRRDIDTVVCRHEAGAGFMALADARLTGRPGIACVSRGPGASNAAIAVHAAEQEGVPFILLVGQVSRRFLRRNSFQEIDFNQMFGSIAKWVAELTEPARTAETLMRAIRIATAGQPGPVVLSIPEDVLAAVTRYRTIREQGPLRAAPHPPDVATVRCWLSQAERPLVICGGILDPSKDRELLRSFLERWNLPTLVSFRERDLLPSAHRLYVGELGLANPAAQIAVLNESDLVLVIGARLGDVTTQGYTFPRSGEPGMRLVHVHPDCSAMGIHLPTDLSIACDARAFMEALGDPGVSEPAQRTAWIERLKAELRTTAIPLRCELDDGLAFEAVAEVLGRSLPADTILTLDAGAFAVPVYGMVAFTPPQRLLAPASGAMGFGVPAAVAAALREPGRTVICVVGDGGLLMSGSELAVASERRLPLKVIVSENGVYGSIRAHQERRYPGRTVGTGFWNPDLELIGRAFGFNVTRIERAESLDALPRILTSSGPEFVVVNTSIKSLMPTAVAAEANRVGE